MELQTTAQINSLPLLNNKSYDAAIKTFNNVVDEVTEKTIVEYLEKCKSELKPATYNHKRAALKKSLLKAIESTGKDSTILKYRINEIFKSQVKTIQTDLSITENETLTQTELDKLIETAPHRTALIIQALYQSGCRISELLSIRLSNITHNQEHVSIIIVGKRSKARTVYLKADLFNDIQAEFKGMTYLFETNNGKQLNRSNVYRMIQASGKQIGIRNLHPHTIRHTFATLNIDRLGLHKASKYLGHSDVSTTSKFYIHQQATASEILI